MLLFVSLMACTPARNITHSSQQAHEAFLEGDYRQALSLYEPMIRRSRDQGQRAEDLVVKRAGLAAWQLGETTKALEYLEVARHSPQAGPETFAALARAYRQVDNLSREITNLEQYLELAPEGPENETFRKRLFITYVESRNWQEALALGASLDAAARNNEEIMDAYFQINKNLENEAQTTSWAHELLKKNQDHTGALRWLAEKHYRLAENRYQAETKAYEQNRTNRQYAQLLEAFEILNTDFRISHSYFLRLYQLQPSQAVAAYIANIYTRFNDKEKAAHYNRLAGR